MFTSRAEFRLALRADNADQRLTPLGLEIGCVSDMRQRAFHQKMEEIASARTALTQQRLSPRELSAYGLRLSQDGARRDGFELLSLGEEARPIVESLFPAFAAFGEEVRDQVATDALYAQYLHRQEADARLLQQEEQTIIPADFDYDLLSGLSNELTVKLKRQRPENLSHAARIEGMTPAALTLILAHLRKAQRNKAS